MGDDSPVQLVPSMQYNTRDVHSIQKVAVILNSSSRESFTTLPHAVQHHALVTPERPAFFFRGVLHVYAGLWQAARHAAAVLQQVGVAPGDRVGLYLPNSPHFLAVYLGVHLCRAVAVLINVQYRRGELQHILTDAGVTVCITDSDQLPELRVAAPPGVTTVLTVPFSQAVPLVAPRLPLPDDLALLVYTSGTTGKAKGAMHTHATLLANSRAITQAWHWMQTDRLLLTLPLFHMHGLGVGVHGSWLTGACFDLHERFDAQVVLDGLLARQVTMFFGVPTMYQRLLAVSEAERVRLPALRLYVSGSAPLSPQTFATFQSLTGQTIVERYGMTETGMNLTNPYRGERRPGTVGMPFPGQAARIADPVSDAPLPPGAVGEVQVQGGHVFAGYWQNPDATAAAFTADGWFKTGDRGWCSDDGYYTLVGRAHDLIITGGYNVYPREVEDVLLAHPAVAEVAVLGLPHADMGEQVVAVVVPHDHAAPPPAAALIAHCRAVLAAYKQPRQVWFDTALPRNALGKVQKHVLRDILLPPDARNGGGA